MTRSPSPTGTTVRWQEISAQVPTLRVRAAPGGRVLVEAGDDTLLLARVDRHWAAASLAYPHAGRPLGLLAPWTAAECRRIGTDVERWLWEIRGRLRESPRSPLHAGGWALTSHPDPWPTVAGLLHDTHRWSADDLLVEPALEPDGSATGEIDYFRSTSIVPLRALSAPDAPRVRAQRRLVQEGTLAPVVLLWVSGLASHVLLDGHDRVVAAMIEGATPTFACLSRTDPEADERVTAQAVADYERTMGLLDHLARVPERLPNPDEQRARAARRLAADLAAHHEALTRAWPLDVSQWEAVARRVAPGWLGAAPD